MLKKIASLLVLVVLFACFSPVIAAKPNFAPDLPENSGTYDVPGHPRMKVRVFVHKAKPAPTPEPTKVCSPDINSYNNIVNGAGWVMQGSWEYRINPSVPATISGNLETIVAKSFDAWTKNLPPNSGVTITKGQTTSVSRAVYDGQNIIAWGRTSASALGVTYIWYLDGVALELDTIMNAKYKWNWADSITEGNLLCGWSNAYDAQNILTHELGHWFGLDDHYTDEYKNHTMYGYGSIAEVKKDTLTNGDIAGIEAIY